MKKHVLTLFVCSALLTSIATKVQAQSPLSFGVKAGVSLPTTSEDDYEIRPGFVGGMVVDYEFSRNFFFRSGLEFVMKGAKLNIKGKTTSDGDVIQAFFKDEDRVRLNYLQVPITIGYKTDLGKDLKGYINVGPYLAYGVYGKSKRTITTTPTEGSLIKGGEDITKRDSFDDLYLNKFDFGVTSSIGIEYSRYFINIGYEYGIDCAKQLDGGEWSWHNINGTCTLGYKF